MVELANTEMPDHSPFGSPIVTGEKKRLADRHVGGNCITLATFVVSAQKLVFDGCNQELLNYLRKQSSREDSFFLKCFL